MTHQITLEIPDEVYQPLAAKAQEMGETIEAAAQACLAASLQAPEPGSRLRRWAGAFDSGVNDAATRHHDITTTWDNRCKTSFEATRMLRRFVDTSARLILTGDSRQLFPNRPELLFQE